jgi:glycosyltransferase involved in cell wall biosynthesis
MNKSKNILSIIIPVYNEEGTLKKIIYKVKKVSLKDLNKEIIKKEIIIVDDCSKDSSRDILKNFKNKDGFKVVLHDMNLGKGSAIRTGLNHSTGNIILIQDADLEYDPNDYHELIKPILKKECQVVYGSRYLSEKGHLKEHNHLTFEIHKIGNQFLSLLTSLLYFHWLSDMETCYKVFTRNALEKIRPLKAKRFDFEPEITAKFLKKGFKIKEVPISYYSRDFDEGKKITWKDGLKAVYYLIKYRITN